MSSMNKISSVEGIRGLACLMVLISHLTLIFFPYLHGQQDHLIKTHLDKVIFQLPFGFLYSGSTAVYIFFALSGFILTYALCLCKQGKRINKCGENVFCEIFQARYTGFDFYCTERAGIKTAPK
ncbi:acyltransferase [Cronobacter sakazakii]|nr:acyltransferase [Cronobacter sakazakii]ELY3996110.1 acyltransferase [Cronobacter sakazakii]ELY4094186.1 acyltransferase [Cronobacter sakazakii]ELY4404505.1 acyltransferase [Cronobacter sakazakii]ELY4431838.1 acyltransferase [Cronobacter sakazakii]